MTTDDDSYVCDLCGETFERPSELGGHKRGHQLTVGREEFQAELSRLADEFEQTPTVSMMNEHGAYSSGPATNHFDSWTAALNSIGLSPVQQDKIPAAEVKADIRTVAREIGHPPPQRSITNVQNTTSRPHRTNSVAGTTRFAPVGTSHISNRE